MQLLATLAATVCQVLDYRVIRNYEQAVYLTQAQALADEAGNRARLFEMQTTLVAVLAFSALLMLAWLYFAYVRAWRTHAAAMRFSPGQALASFLLPVVHLWQPAQVLEDLWAVSLATPRTLDMPRLLVYWQVLWRATLLLGYLHLLLGSPDSFDTAKLANGIAIGFYLCGGHLPGIHQAHRERAARLALA